MIMMMLLIMMINLSNSDGDTFMKPMGGLEMDFTPCCALGLMELD